jgi:hypothetical protein
MIVLTSYYVLIHNERICLMTRIRKLFTFPLDPELAVGLRHIKARDGIPLAEQVRRGIRLWLESKGVIEGKRKRSVGALEGRRRP